MKRYEHQALWIDRSPDDAPDLGALETTLSEWGADGWAVVGLTPGFVLLQREVDDAAPAVSVTLPDPASLPLGAVAWARRSDGRSEAFEVRPADPPAPARGPCRRCGLLLPALPAQRACAHERGAWCEPFAPEVLDALAPPRNSRGLACYGEVRDGDGEGLRVLEAGVAGAEEIVWLITAAGIALTPKLNAAQARALAAALLCFANRLSPRAAAALVTPPEGP